MNETPKGLAQASLPTMKIAQLSEAAEVSKSTIHSYVRKGLLPPPQKAGLGLYLYSQQHLERLKEIRRLREKGNLPILEIKGVVNTGNLVATAEQLPRDGAGDGGSLDPGQVRTEANEEKRQQIVDMAIELFNRLGYARVRVSDITDSLNMGKGTFYLYFHNKEELLLECFTNLAGLILPLERRETVRGEKDFFLRARARFIGFQEQYDRFAGIMSLIRTASRSDTPEISRRAAEAYDAIVDPLRRDLARAIKEGSARKVDEELAVYALLGAADFLCYRGTLDSRYTRQEITDFVHDWVENALRFDALRPGEGAAPQAFEGMLTDCEGTCTAVENVCFDDKPYLLGALGQAAIEVEPERIASIVIVEADSVCRADVTMKDGRTASLQIKGDVIVSGQTALGTIRIALRDVSCLAFAPDDCR